MLWTSYNNYVVTFWSADEARVCRDYLTIAQSADTNGSMLFHGIMPDILNRIRTQQITDLSKLFDHCYAGMALKYHTVLFSKASIKNMNMHRSLNEAYQRCSVTIAPTVSIERFVRLVKASPNDRKTMEANDQLEMLNFLSCLYNMVTHPSTVVPDNVDMFKRYASAKLLKLLEPQGLSKSYITSTNTTLDLLCSSPTRRSFATKLIKGRFDGIC